MVKKKEEEEELKTELKREVPVPPVYFHKLANHFYEVIIRLSVSESYRNCLTSVGGVGFQMQHLFF